MTKRDYAGYIVDITGDGGDSAHFAGMSGLFGNSEPLKDYVLESGEFVRHPNQSPWNNPKNFTVDQMCPLIAGLYAQGRSDLVKKAFFKAAKRWFFAQNIERDKPGSKKYLWPHEFWKDSNPTAITFKKDWNWKQFKFVGVLEKIYPEHAMNHTIESKILDWADPMSLSTIWHHVLCAKIKYLYFLGVIGYPALALAIIFHGLFNNSDDEGQIISKAKRAGQFFVWLYKKAKPDYAAALERYWMKRRYMPEMYLSILSGLGN